jgi:serine/threonine protein phosphatase PrpC
MDPERALEGLLEDLDETLLGNTEIDSTMSGTTACLAYFDYDAFYVANVGDSR